MSWVVRFHRWRARRRAERHARWCRKMHVMMLARPPHHSTQRNRTQEVP